MSDQIKAVKVLMKKVRMKHMAAAKKLMRREERVKHGKPERSHTVKKRVYRRPKANVEEGGHSPGGDRAASETVHDAEAKSPN